MSVISKMYISVKEKSKILAIVMLAYQILLQLKLFLLRDQEFYSQRQ